jgi:murein DD-endopeptidase MepM/ murein hydrolase activator NlpD
MTQLRKIDSIVLMARAASSRWVWAAIAIGSVGLWANGAIAEDAILLDPSLEPSAEIQATSSSDDPAVPSAEELLAPVPIAPSQPAAADWSAPTFESPTVTVESSGSSESLSVNDLMNEPPRTIAPSTAGNTYIDHSSDYNLGATRTPDRVGSVVLSERSTGCHAVFQSGQSISGACSPADLASASDGSRVNIGPLSFGADGVTVAPPSFDSFYSVTTRPVSQPNNGDRSLIFPLSVPAPITSLFGWRMHPIFGDLRFHAGTDIGAPLGTPVVASFSGEVVVSDFLQGYGLTVILLHNDGAQETLYAHLSEVFVKPGDVVAQGDVIGRVGSTGNSTGPHLHFEVRELEKGVWVTLNPIESLEVALNNFLNQVPGLVSTQSWSKVQLRAGLARSPKRSPAVARRLGQYLPIGLTRIDQNLVIDAPSP